MLTRKMRAAILEYQSKASVKAWLEDVPGVADAVDAGLASMEELESLAGTVSSAVMALSRVDDAAFEDGRKAFEDGGDYGDCPHPEGSPEWASWKAGWEAAQAARLDRPEGAKETP